jgi:hypothetical protein
MTERPAHVTNEQATETLHMDVVQEALLPEPADDSDDHGDDELDE